MNSGLYNLTVTDAAGCSKTKSAYVGIRSLSISTLVTNPACAGGNDGELSITSVHYGTAPFTYLWDTGDTTASITGLASGKYVVTVKDSAGCSIKKSLNISDRMPLSVSYSVSPRDCSTDSDAGVAFHGTGGGGAYEFYLGDSLVSSPLILPGTGDCLASCWQTEITKLLPVDDQCYEMELLVRTTGSCAHDLSHLVVGLEDAFISNLTNSRNFKMEMNATDPKSGINGFKIDDISGFGNDGSREFSINFDVCFRDGENYLPASIPVLYKAATCQYIEEISVLEKRAEASSIFVASYPNPFVEETNINVNTPKDTEVTIAVFDLRGNKIAQLYKGRLKANVNYSFPFNSGCCSDNIFIYTIMSDEELIQGQFLRLR